ncbi:MAG TPA: hypothetical protein VK674_01345 [Candidatus Limnocylindria bacterium]|nr:hypothetical protein [Candidatus Limnocylindria bacterium]
MSGSREQAAELLAYVQEHQPTPDQPNAGAEHFWVLGRTEDNEGKPVIAPSTTGRLFRASVAAMYAMRDELNGYALREEVSDGSAAAGPRCSYYRPSSGLGG